MKHEPQHLSLGFKIDDPILKRNIKKVVSKVTFPKKQNLRADKPKELLLDFFRIHCKEHHETWTEYDITQVVKDYLKKITP